MKPFRYPPLSDYRRRQLMQHAMAALEAQQQLVQWGGAHQFMLDHSHHVAQDGRSVQEIQQGFIADWHYPKGDRIDYNTGGQYFYHCHREDFETEEHGHFHVFVRQKGWPTSWRLAAIPDRDGYLDNPMAHIGCIALNRYGQPVRLFMVNRWVSRESWFDADKMQRLVKRFSVARVKDKHKEQDNKWQVMDQWVENLVHLFLPQMQWLYTQRDNHMASHVRKQDNPYQDRSIEEMGDIAISLEQQIGWLTS